MEELPSEPPSLRQLALIQCMRFSNLVDDIGDIRYRLIQPLLAKLSAEQLSTIERTRPHIALESDELWRALIARDFPDRPLPKHHFRDTYAQMTRDKESQLGAARERLRRLQKQYDQAKRASAVTTLTEAPPRRRTASTLSPTYRSLSMNKVAKSMHSHAHLRPRPRIDEPPTKKVRTISSDVATDVTTPKPQPVHPHRAVHAQPQKRQTTPKRLSSIFLPRR